MASNLTQLFLHLNSLFVSNSNFENNISNMDISESESLLNELKGGIWHNDEELLIFRRLLCVYKFYADMLTLLSDIESIIYEKLDPVVENKLKCEFVVENITKLNNVFMNISSMKEYAFKKRNGKALTLDEIRRLEIEPVPTWNNYKGSLIDYLHSCKNQHANIGLIPGSLFNLSIDEMTLFFPIYYAHLKAKDEVIQLALRIIHNHENLLDEVYQIKNLNGFPIINKKKLIYKNISKKKGLPNPTKKEYSHKEIAIAFKIMDETITEKKAIIILTKYSKNKSVAKLLLTQNSIKLNQLNKLSQNKTTDTRHYEALKNAKRLLKSIKHQNGLTAISTIIAEFQAGWENYY